MHAPSRSAMLLLVPTDLRPSSAVIAAAMLALATMLQGCAITGEEPAAVEPIELRDGAVRGPSPTTDPGAEPVDPLGPVPAGTAEPIVTPTTPEPAPDADSEPTTAPPEPDDDESDETTSDDDADDTASDDAPSDDDDEDDDEDEDEDEDDSDD